jgi:hypothetical protein
MLALAHWGVTHVRGKDCVHPDIGRVIVRMISFPARESGQRARCSATSKRACTSLLPAVLPFLLGGHSGNASLKLPRKH